MAAQTSTSVPSSRPTFWPVRPIPTRLAIFVRCLVDFRWVLTQGVGLQQVSTPLTLPPPRHIGRYEILDVISHGDIGTIGAVRLSVALRSKRSTAEGETSRISVRHGRGMRGAHHSEELIASVESGGPVTPGCRRVPRSAHLARRIIRISSVFACLTRLLICGLWVRFPLGSTPLALARSAGPQA
jgi:hypothetical protein